jgi:hypothetical protein
MGVGLDGDLGGGVPPDPKGSGASLSGVGGTLSRHPPPGEATLPTTVATTPLPSGNGGSNDGGICRRLAVPGG